MPQAQTHVVDGFLSDCDGLVQGGNIRVGIHHSVISLVFELKEDVLFAVLLVDNLPLSHGHVVVIDIG